MIEPTSKDIGRAVIYRDASGKIEVGTITSYDPMWVFVRYGQGITSAATARRDLYWESPIEMMDNG